MSSDDGTIISWLQAAVTFLNPLRVWGHSVEPGRMVEFMQEMQPPPKKLRDAWDICVIPLRGEPTIAYMLRCLANHSITCLSPEFAVVTPDIMRASECPAFHESYGISAERCRVLSTRNDPDNPTFVQRGWHILTCESCLLRSDVVGNTELPIHYGGLNCVCCGASLPRVPAYYVATHCEVCCADGLQRLAVSFGESNQEVLQIGATVDVVMIRCQYSQGTNIVISNAVPVQHNPAGGLDYVGPLPGVPWTPRYYPRFDELVGHVAPNVMHNVGCKQITLMAAVHTLYRLRQKDGVYRLTPLHILITGPTRSGKSTILMAAQRMLGRHAAAHAILESATLGANLLPTPSFFERTKNHSRGAVAPSDVLLLDVMSEFSASDFWVMMFLLRYGTCSAGEQLSTTAVNPQIMAALHCTSRSAQKLQKYFSLVIPMQPPPSSAADNARMGQRVEHSSYPQPSSSRSRSASDRHSSRLAMEIKQTTTAGMDESLADLLEMMVCRCPEVHVLEQRIREALTILLIRFRTGENESGQSTDTSWLPLKSNRSRIEEAKFLLIVRELCLARLLIEGRSDVVWTDSMSQEVWTLYKLHTLGIETISRGLEESTGSKRSTGKRRARLAFVDELRRKQAKEANTVVTENAVKDVFEGFGGRDAMGDYLETVLDELQQLGFLIRRQGGWHATKVT